MKNVKIKDLQNVELEILDEFIRICDKYHLDYFLAGGSCLGAVRHRGFIPWDDDIDVGMTRINYDKFFSVAKEELNSNYFLQDFNTEENCGLVFGKLRKNGTILSETYSYHIKMNQGVWIDIFPFDNVSDNAFNRKINFLRFSIIKKLYIIKCGYKMPERASKVAFVFYCFGKLIVKPFSLSFFINKLGKVMNKYNNRETQYMFPYGGAYKEKDMLTKEMVTNIKKIEFEGRFINTYKNYDEYLRHLYGNYHELPPVEKRNGGSHFVHECKLEKENK